MQSKTQPFQGIGESRIVNRGSPGMRRANPGLSDETALPYHPTLCVVALLTLCVGASRAPLVASGTRCPSPPQQAPCVTRPLAQLCVIRPPPTPTAICRNAQRCRGPSRGYAGCSSPPETVR
jgi:hypothetical protein